VRALAPIHRPSREVRIAQIVARLNIGGPAIYTVMLASHFNRRNYRSLLIVGKPLEHEGDMNYLLGGTSVEVEVVPTLGREISPLKDIRSFFHMKSLLRRFRPHIVHTHTAKAGVIGRTAAVLSGIRNTVHTFHGHTFAHYFGPVKNCIFMNLERMLAHSTSKIIAVTAQQVRDLVEVYRIAPAPKVVEIPYGLDLSGFLACESKRDVIRSELPAGRDEVVVGIAGRLYPIKAHDFFIMSAACLLERRKDVHFVIVGDGEERARLERLVQEKGITSNVHFLGWRTDMAAAYAAMDIVALTSLNEGSPFSLIEGMACGLPAVSTPAGGVPDLFVKPRREGDLRIAQNGILVDRRDPALFANALERLVVESRLRKEMGAAARQFVSTRFRRERLLADMENLYLSLLPWAESR
jgi:glycosyltransferase involved in cell wall biosynthesis